MTGSRTIRVIFILILAMTAGAIALRAMETKPSAPPYRTDLIAATPGFGPVFDTDVPLKAGSWRHIVLHDTGKGEAADIVKRAHFVVDADGTQLVRATDLWKAQRGANHVNSAAHNYNADSISIVVQGDFSRRSLSASSRQFQELVSLVRSLKHKQACNIDTSRVYRNRPDLSGGSPSLGKSFPIREFTRQLNEPQADE
jgi:hypothetical protein